MLNRDRIKELVVMQNNLNKATAGAEWALKGFDWKLYATMEAAEAIESLPYKHWKKSEANFENVKVEVVDIFHFMFSDSIPNYDILGLVDIIDVAQIEADGTTPALLDAPSLISIFQAIIGVLQSTEDDREDWQDEFLYRHLFLAWKILGETPESLYKAYMVKNTLNGFRQTNGYKDGSYKKMWKFKGKVVEDNVVAYSLAENIVVDSNFTTLLLADITIKYQEA